MTTLYLRHSDCQKHLMMSQHPENPARLQAIEKALAQPLWDNRLERREAHEIDERYFANIHPRNYLDMLSELRPGEGFARIDASIPFHGRGAALISECGKRFPHSDRCILIRFTLLHSPVVPDAVFPSALILRCIYPENHIAKSYG